jgi:hypothetical protein
MKNIVRTTALALVAALFASCTTSYDSYGQRRQSIDPGAAAIGAVALGAIAYSAGKSKGKRDEHRRHTYNSYGGYGYGYQGGYAPRYRGR